LLVFTERRERALAIGLGGAITCAAIALGPIVGWLLELSVDWRSIFFAMTPIAAIAGVLVAGMSPEGFQNYSSPGRRGVHRRESQFWNPSDRGVQIVRTTDTPVRDRCAGQRSSAIHVACAVGLYLVYILSMSVSRSCS
jgi:MFS family permease